MRRSLPGSVSLQFIGAKYSTLLLLRALQQLKAIIKEILRVFNVHSAQLEYDVKTGLKLSFNSAFDSLCKEFELFI